MSNALDSATTGGLANTRVDNEAYTLTSSTGTRAVVFSKGCGYWQDISVVDTATGLPLVKNTDYLPIDLCSVPTKIAGIDVYSSFVVVKDGVTNIQVSYSFPNDFQADASIVSTLSNLLAALTSSDRKTWWADIKNRPVLFNPTFHRHNLSKATGYEYLINTLDQLIKIMILGDEIGHNDLRNYIEDRLKTHYAALIADFTEINNSTMHAIAALNARITANVASTNSLLTKIDTLIANQSTYQTVFTTLPAAVTTSQTSAQTWASNLSF